VATTCPWHTRQQRHHIPAQPRALALFFFNPLAASAIDAARSLPVCPELAISYNLAASPRPFSVSNFALERQLRQIDRPRRQIITFC